MVIVAPRIPGDPAAKTADRYVSGERRVVVERNGYDRAGPGEKLLGVKALLGSSGHVGHLALEGPAKPCRKRVAVERFLYRRYPHQIETQGETLSLDALRQGRRHHPVRPPPNRASIPIVVTR